MLCRFLIVFALVSVFIGAPPAAAFATSVNASVPMGEMDCCPEADAPNPCKSCPAMVICVLKTFQATTLLGITELSRLTHVAHFDEIAQTADSRAGVPPDHPPRSLT